MDILVYILLVIVFITLLIKLLQLHTLKILKCQELVHPDYPKRFLYHRRKYSTNFKPTKFHEDLLLICKFLRANQPETDKIVIWLTPFVANIIYVNAESAKQVYLNNFFEKSVLHTLGDINQSLFSMPNKNYTKIRKIIQPAFSSNNLEKLTFTFNKHARIFVKNLQLAAGVSSQSTKSREIDILYYTKRLIFDVTGEAAFAFNFNSQNDESMYEIIEKYMKSIQLRTFNPLAWSDYLFPIVQPKCYRAFQDFFKMIYPKMDNMIEQEQNKMKQEILNLKSQGLDRSDIQAETVIDFMIKSYLNGEIDKKHIYDNCIVMIIGGMDTCGNVLSTGIWYLGKYPEVQKELQQEIDKFLPEVESFEEVDKFEVSYEDLNKLKYLNSFIKEILRLHPPAPSTMRMMDSRLKLILPTIVSVASISLHRDENYFKNPEKFDFKRFLHEKELDEDLEKSSVCPFTSQKSRNPFTYVPFAAGKRNCIGQNFAMINLLTAFSYVLKFYQVTNATDQLNIEWNIACETTNSKIKLQPRKFS